MMEEQASLGGEPPDTPMEEGDTQARSAKKQRPAKRSFADAVSDFNPPPSADSSRIEANEWAFEDIDVESDSEPDAADLADGRPRVTFSKALRKELCSAWKMALIIKYLGKNIHFNVLNQRLPTMWNLQGKMTLIDIGYGCFIARFDNKLDYLHVLLDGPWKIFDNYLVAQRWEPAFRPRTAKFSKMAVWVRLPELPMEYFRDDTIRGILENVGKPLKLDRTTIVAAKGRFARAAVEIDMNKPLVSEIWVDNAVQSVEYEGLHVVCFKCGVLGHREQTCPDSMQAETGVQSTTPNEEQPPLHSAMDIPNTNGTAAVGTGSLAHTQPPTHTPLAQTKPRYGTWMLVTRKNHQATEVANNRQSNSRKDSSIKAPQATNPRQPKKNQNGPRNQGKNSRHPRKENHNTTSQNNQFGILADLHDHADAPARNNSTVNDNSTSRPLPRARSKSPMHTRTPQSSVRSPQPTSTTDQPVNPQATRMESRGRGGRAGNNRGRGRGEGRGLPGNAFNPALESSAIHWNALSASTLFQFGNNQPAADRLTSFNPNQFVMGSTSGFTPGEGGDQTSPDSRSLS